MIRTGFLLLFFSFHSRHTILHTGVKQIKKLKYLFLTGHPALVEGISARGGGWDEMIFKVPSNPNQFVIPWFLIVFIT